MGTKVLVTGGTKKDIDAMAVLALNVKEKTPGLADEMVVFHDGVSEELQEKFQMIMPTRFIRYRCPVSKWKLWRNPTIRYFSEMVFCKIECFRLLKEYETVVWSDYDVIIKEDLSALLDEKEAFSFVSNTETTLSDMFHKNICQKNMSGYDMDGVSICTPLFVLKSSEDVDYDKYCDWYYHALKEYAKFLYLPEQCLFTMMVQKFEMPYHRLDNRVYSTHPRDDAEDVKIIHAYGQPKFWNGLENQVWNRYNQEWMKIKGE